MLILTRRLNEVICIGDDIRVVVCEIDRGKVRLGVDAPLEVVVDRLEIREQKLADAAAKPNDPQLVPEPVTE